MECELGGITYEFTITQNKYVCGKSAVNSSKVRQHFNK